MRILATGTAGFIGSAFARLLLGKGESPGNRYDFPEEAQRLVSLDALTYAACLENLNPIQEDPRHRFVEGNICDAKLVEELIREEKIDTIVNFAAESHVDRSIESSAAFLESNVGGTVTLLDAARKNGCRFVQVSTDEVYGTLGDQGSFTEETPLAPNSPYSASKAAADCFVRSYYETHKLPCVITRCSNNYGPYQFPEKFLPLAITRLLGDGKIPVYGTGKNVRDWIHVEDHAYGVYLSMIKGGWKSDVYNFGGFGEKENIEMAKRLLKMLGRGEERLEFVEDRKGHDWRYSMDSSKAQTELGWKPAWSLDEGLEHMVAWYKENEAWWRAKL